MNFDRPPRLSERKSTPDRLWREAWHFANTLTNGNWSSPQYREVEETRSVIEMLGSEFEIISGTVKPIYNETVLTFNAFKRHVEIEDEEGYIAPAYDITSSTTQDISVEELPLNVLEEILVDVDEDEHPLEEAFESCIESSASDLSQESRRILISALGDVLIQRSQEESYSVNERGNIDSYEVRYLYMLDEQNVHEVDYSSLNGELSWQPISLYDGRVVERKPIGLLSIGEEDLESNISTIDDDIEYFLTSEEIYTLSALAELSQKERTRRVLSMLSLVSSGFVDFRSPRRRVQKWYNTTYDYLLHRR
jgi:hypothetical protein